MEFVSVCSWRSPRPTNQHTDACNQMNLIRFCLVTHAFVVVDNFSRILAHTCSINILRANIFHYYYYVCVCCARRLYITGANGMERKKEVSCASVCGCVPVWGRGVMATINCFARVNRLTVFMFVFWMRKMSFFRCSTSRQSNKVYDYMECSALDWRHRKREKYVIQMANSTTVPRIYRFT